MKTPEKMAEEYADLCVSDAYYAPLKAGFLAGYQAAKDQVLARFKSLLSSFAETSFNPNHTAWQIFDTLNENQAAQDQVADADKVMPQWISVSDRLPDTYQRVLILIRGRIFISSIEEEYGDEYRDGAIRFWDGDWDWPEVTHWMELPAPPKEEK